MSEPFVRPDVRQFLADLAAQDAPQLYEVSPAEARQLVHKMRHLADLPTGELAVIRDIVIDGPGGALILRLFDRRKDRLPGPALLFLHGGGWVIGDLDSYESLCAEIARMIDLPVVAVEYRLAPEHPFPAAHEDGEAAARWLAASPSALGRSITGLVLAGDSAGGMLAITAAMALRDAPAETPVIATWLAYPVIDTGRAYPSQARFGEGYFLTRAGMAWFVDCYRPDRADWRAAPLKGDLAGLPPCLVTTASLDPLLDQGRAWAAACIQAGIATVYREAAGNIHGYLQLRRAIPSAQGDLAGSLIALRALLREIEGDRVMAQAAEMVG